MGRLVWEIRIKRPIKILSFRAYNINGGPTIVQLAIDLAMVYVCS